MVQEDKGDSQMKEEFSHSPGPWCWRPKNKYVYLQDIEGNPVSSMSVYWPSDSLNRQAANVSLVAAAPDLFAALQRAYDTFGCDGSSVWEEVKLALDKAAGKGRGADE